MTSVVKACAQAAASSAGFGGGSGSEDHMPQRTSIREVERTSDASMDMLDEDGDDDDMEQRWQAGGSPSPSRGGRPSTASHRKSVFEAPATLDLMTPARTAPSSSGTPARPQSAGGPASRTERTAPVRMPSWRPPPGPPGAAPGPPSEGWAEGPSGSGGQ